MAIKNMLDQNNENICVSVIVPVYKIPENYLRECVSSIQVQSLKEIEIILIDDGSPDDCGRICDELASEDKRILVIHQANSGLAAARNAGAAAARGEYLCFVDADDFLVGETSLMSIYECAISENADIVLYDKFKYYGAELPKGAGSIENREIEPTLLSLVISRKYGAAAWDKLIKKAIIDKYEYKFFDGRIAEDMPWCGDFLYNGHKISYIPIDAYAYRQREGSITSIGNEQKKVSDMLSYFKRMSLQIKQAGGKTKASDNYKAWIQYWAYLYCVLLVNLYPCYKEFKIEAKKYAFLLSKGQGNRVKMISLFCKLFGLKMTSFLLYTAQKSSKKNIGQ